MKSNCQLNEQIPGGIIARLGERVSRLSFRVGAIVLGLSLFSLALAPGQVWAAPKYNANETKALKSFDTPRNDPSNNLNWDTSPVYDHAWDGVTWVDVGGGDYRVKEIAIFARELFGNLNLNSLASLTSLDVRFNRLTALDVTNNAALERLDVQRNDLTALDVAKNSALTSLNVFSNQLTALDVSRDVALTNLDVSYNQLTVLDTSHNAALARLVVDGNRLTVLDLSKNTNLTYLSLENNHLTALDVSSNPALKMLGVGDNRLTALDVSNNTALKLLNVDANKLPLSQLYQFMRTAHLCLSSQNGVIPPGLVGHKLSPNKVYDLSSEMEFNGVTTVFSLTFNNIKATNGEEYSLSPTGELVFNQPGLYQITMTNAAIHDQGVFIAKVATVTTEELKVGP
ncbi:MAG: hypothetical protein LBS60_10015 [Deltaproteobacteria bacterium]|jgi:hypothetical protein|nr:hypothetical protein [Deltaproteobacteria bacterium]